MEDGLHRQVSSQPANQVESAKATTDQQAWIERIDDLNEQIEALEESRDYWVGQAEEFEEKSDQLTQEVKNLRTENDALKEEHLWLKDQLQNSQHALRSLQGSRTVQVSRALGLLAGQLKQTASVTAHTFGSPLLHSVKGAIEGNLDLPLNAEVLAGRVEVSGWAVSSAGPITAVEIWLGATQLGLADYGKTRTDVLTNRPWQLLAECGFTAKFLFDPAENELGAQTLRVVMRDGQGNQLELTRAVEVKPLVPTLAPANPDSDFWGFAESYERYHHWIYDNEPNEADLKTQTEQAQAFANRPLISILTPVYNTPLNVLRDTILSVMAQTYDRWELCLVDGNSSQPYIRTLLKALARLDTRIRVKYLDENLGISGNTNVALEMAEGEFISLLDHDDLLTPFALFEMVKYLNEHPRCEMVYSDEDRLEMDGRRHTPFFKPDWSPDLLQCFMYTGHLTFYRRELVQELGGFRSEYDLSQDYDLALRVSEVAQDIGHVDKVLYHWRMLPGSGSVGDKPQARISNLDALRSAAERRGLVGEVIELPTANWLKLAVTEKAKVSIIVPSDNEQTITRCVAGLFLHTDYADFEVVVVTNSRLIARLAPRYSQNEQIQLVAYNAPFNFSDKCNVGVAHSKGEFVVFYNDDVLPLKGDWLEILLGYFQQPEVGAVSPKLIYSNGLIQHAGLVTGVRGMVGTAFHTLPADNTVYFNLAQSTRTTSSLSAACLIMRKRVFEEIGGYDAVNTPIMHSDIDLCFKIREAGLRLVYTPFAMLEHAGHASLGEVERQGHKHSEKSDMYVLKRWGHYTATDPYFNTNMRDYLYHDSPTPYRMYADDRPELAGRAGKDILVVSHDLSLTGAPIVMTTLTEALGKQHFFTVVSPSDGKLRTTFRDQGWPVIIDSLIREAHPATNKLMDDFDLIVANTILNWRVILAAKALGKPVIWFIHESDFGVQLAQREPGVRRALLEADQIIYPSLETERKYRRFFQDSDNHTTVHYGLKTLPPFAASASERLRVVHNGSVESRKGQDILVKSILSLPASICNKFEFYFVGRMLDKPFFQRLQRQTAHLANVHWVGEVSHHEAMRYTGEADIFVCTSRDDPSPLVVLEALSQGKALISTTVGVMREIIQDGENGFLVPVEDSAALTVALEKLAADETLRQTLGKAALQTFQEQFDLDRYSADIDGYIEQLTGTQPTALAPELAEIN